MAQQSVKFIDVTKTFIPIDPKAFPESMQGTGREDAPENRIPAAAYDGQNFMPTSYGYKSYFGTNGKISIDALDVRVDTVFTFQTETFENLLIALTEDGIWIKNGASSGAWTHAKTLPLALLGTHYNWSYVIISDELYCYRQGSSLYYKITSAAAAPYYTITEVTPTFLNMVAQIGIFRAGGRLGFWDSADSISWSSPDDLGDFTPSIETAAGNALFSDINGRIVTIKPHGDGFMVYASRSIVYIAQALESTFSWNPQVVLSNAGIAYPEECTVGTPDTLHFARTSVGIHKIEKAVQEIIVPEVQDFLKEFKGPIYPKVIQGRFLFLQMLDPEYMNGLADFKDEIVPAYSYNLPGFSQTLVGAISDSLLTGNDICITISGYNVGAFPEQQPEDNGISAGAVAAADKKVGTKWKPKYKAFISNNGFKGTAPIFSNAPCGGNDLNGNPLNFTPLGVGNRLDGLTQDSTNKTPINGEDAYVDGIWTIERFIAVQSAIWEMEEQALNEFIGLVSSKSYSGSKEEVVTVAVNEETKGTCVIGDYVTAYSGPQFGMSKCSFWLTRYALQAATLKTIRHFKIASTREEDFKYSWFENTGPYFSTKNEACVWGGNNFYLPDVKALTYVDPIGCRDGNNVGYGTPYTFEQPWNKRTDLNVYNTLAYKDISPTPETGYCELVGWTYTKSDNTQAFLAKGTSCEQPNLLAPGQPARAVPAPKAGQDRILPGGPSGNGRICSIPFEPVTIPGTPPVVINWPDQVVTIPEGGFLLQKGSIAPVYPDFYGALVYDLHLKKWGKMKVPYKQLLDYSPLNSFSGGGIPYERFGILGGVLKGSGYIHLFDAFPSDSYITYGKIGYYRLGMTRLEEARVHFKTLGTGTVTVEGSMNGRVLSIGLSKTVPFTNANSVEFTGEMAARWYNITIEGIYDIQYLEYRGFIQGKR